jgi:putative transposase
MIAIARDQKVPVFEMIRSTDGFRRQKKRRRRFDRQVYRQRFRVECFFQRLKRFRRIGTRYDRRATNFLDLILLGAIALWVF